MAFPTIPTGGRILAANQLDTTATRTFPSLTGLTSPAGELIIAVIVAYQTSTGTNAAFSGWTGGFTEFHDSATSTTMAIGCAYKWSSGSETGTFAVTQAGTITGDASMIVMSITGAHASTPPEAGSRVSGTTALPDPGSFNPAGWDVEDTLWINVLGSGCTNISSTWTALGSSAPTNYSGWVDTNAADTSVIGDTEAAVAFRQNAVAAEDVGTASGIDLSNARNAALVIAVRPAAPPSITQAAYQWYEEGTESGAVAYAAQDTAVVGDISNGDATGTLRIRLQSTTAVAVPATDDFQLQYEKNTSGTWINITAVTTTVSTYDSPNLTNAAATTNRLTGGTGTFVAGKVSEDALMDDLGWAGNNYTEIVYALKVKAADVANGDTLRFRVLKNAATTNMTYSVTPTINIIQSFDYNETGRNVGVVTTLITETDRANLKELVLAVTTVATIVVTDTFTLGPPPVIQEGFRWRNDDGSETAATWKAAQDTNATLEIGTQVARLRVLLDTTADVTSTYVLRYKKTTDSTWLPVPVGSGGGDPVYVATSANIVASGEASTALLTPPSGKTTTDFSVGRVWDDENGTDLVAIIADTGWTPADITGLTAWFDASDTSSITSSGGLVSQWNDKSGNGKHVTQATTGNKPTTGVNTINGRNVITFDYAHHMANTSTQMVNATTGQWSAVYLTKPSGTNINRCIISSEDRFFAGMYYNALQAQTYNAAGTNQVDYTANNFVAGDVLVGSAVFTGTTLEAWLNGISDGSTAFTGTVRTTASWMSIGQAYGSHVYAGDIAEIVFYNVALSAAERTTVENYLRAKWILPVDDGLVGWWDASVTASVSGTSTQISQWSDLSGNDRHLIPVDAVNNTSRLQAVNGKQMVALTAYTGVTTQLRVSGWTRSTIETIIGVLWINGEAEALSSFIPNAWREVSGGDRYVYYYYGGNWYDGWTVSFLASPTIVLQGDPGAHILATHHNGASSWLDHDGWRTNGTLATTSPVGLDIGGSGWLGWNDTEPGMAFGEVLVYDRALTSGELSQTYSYLSKKWGTFLQPTDITGLQAWYDASDGSTFSYSSGTVVSQWNDKSGNGRHLSQGTVANQPSRSGVQNGSPTVVFDGSGDLLPSSSFTLNAPFTIVMAMTWNTYAFMGPMAGSNFSIYNVGGSIRMVGSAEYTLTHDVGTSPSTWAFVFNGASSAGYRDGVQIGSSGNTGTSGTTTGITQNFWGTQFETIIYNKVLSTTERRWVERYLKAKWATP